MTESNAPQESKVEGFKKASNYLRGTIAETLESDATHFDEADVQLLKTHGTYQQDDRDQRRTLRSEGKEKAYQFMIRAAIPGGVLTADQYLALDALADSYGGGSLRVTTRQGIQFHGILMRDLKAHIAAMNSAMVTTLSACGDVGRNVMACPAPLADEAHETMRRVAREVAAELRPATRAYHEIWLDGEKHTSTMPEEPFYGDRYLPRKFKTGITHTRDNSIDLYSYDCGLIAFIENGRVTGYNVVVGGGMGMTHNKPDTFAALAQPLGYIAPQHAVEAVKTVAAIFRDFGNRADRRHARLKYLIAEWGMDRFREEFRSRVAFALDPFKQMPKPAYEDYIGVNEQDDGRCFYGVFVENGRIVDRDTVKLKSALREIVGLLKPGITLTPNQNVLLTGIERDRANEVERLLSGHGVVPPRGLSAARRYSMACPALPTCGLAMAESERVMPSVIDALEAELASLGLRDEPITIRMTGCPNGCTRPYTADIAFVGRSPNTYHVFVGGGLSGDRLADLFAADVATDNFIPTLRPLLTAWSKEREQGESLSDFYTRKLPSRTVRQHITGKEEPMARLLVLGQAP